MGLQTWKNAPDGRVLKSDVTIAKNYLTASQVRELEGAVVGYFDYIERIIKRHQTFTMDQFAKSVNAFLEFNEYEVLDGTGTVSRAQADEKAFIEYEEFNRHQKIESDFDCQIRLFLDTKDDGDLASYYMHLYIANGTVGMLREWVNSGFPVSSRKIAEMMCAFSMRVAH